MIKISKTQLTGTGLQRLIERADGDERLLAIVAALRLHGLHVPAILREIEG